MLNRIKNSQVVNFYVRWRLPLQVTILVLLFFGNCFWSGMVYLVYPVLLGLVCFDDFPNAVSYLVAALPFLALNGALGRFLYLFCVLAVVLKFYLTLLFVEKCRPNWLTLGVISLFIVYCLLPIGPYNSNLWSKLAFLLVVFIMFGVVIGKPAIIRLALNVRLLAITVLIASLLGCLRAISPYLSSLIPLFSAGDWLRFSGLYAHPNNLGMMCSVLVSLFAYLIIRRQAKIGDYLLMFALTAAGLATLSKTCLVIIVLVYVVIFIWLLKHNWAPTVVVSLVVLTVVIGFCCTHNALVSGYLGRFIGGWSAGDGFTAFMNNVTTYRYDLWVSYSTYLWQNPLVLFFGRGLGAGPIILDPRHDRFKGPHNFYLAMVYQLGLVGTAIFVTAVVLLAMELKKHRAQIVHRAIWVPITILLLLLMVEDSILHIVVAS